jgi:hypothetical protein
VIGVRVRLCGLRASEVFCVKLFAARQAFHDGTIGKIKSLRLTGDVRLPAIVWRSKRETQRYQTVAAAVGASGQYPSILPCVASAFRTVANRSHATELRALITASSPRRWVPQRTQAPQRRGGGPRRAVSATNV